MMPNMSATDICHEIMNHKLLNLAQHKNNLPALPLARESTTEAGNHLPLVNVLKASNFDFL
jgi:hypothetical protein